MIGQRYLATMPYDNLEVLATFRGWLPSLLLKEGVNLNGGQFTRVGKAAGNLIQALIEGYAFSAACVRLLQLCRANPFYYK
jgi:hypothetical protein